MINKIGLEKLYPWQDKMLFLAVLLFPIQSLLFYQKSFFSAFSFYGQIASIPILIGLVIAIITCTREKEVKRFLIPISVGAFCYILFIAAVSVHSIAQYAEIGSFNASAFGETPKIHLAKSLLLFLGISSEPVLYSLLIFLRDMHAGVREVVFAFGFTLWIAFLYWKDGRRTFEIIRKAVFWDIALLSPYILLEIFHLYGADWATIVLGTVNLCLYEPCSFYGWYPPLVSPNQVRGPWTEPAYFSIWLAFAAPFLVSFLFENNFSNVRKVLGVALFFVCFWSVWLLTWARTSVVLIGAILVLYGLFFLFSRKRGELKKFAFLSSTLFFAFALVSVFNPSEIGRNLQNIRSTSLTTTIVGSNYVHDVVKSTLNVESRSNPTRLKEFLLDLYVFTESPMLGFGDTLSSAALVKKLNEDVKFATEELRLREEDMQKKGLFQSSFGGGSNLSVSGLLVCRGLLGALVVFLPIIALGIRLFNLILKKRLGSAETGVFISCSAVLLSAFSQGLWFFYFWCSCGLALGIVLKNRQFGRG